MKVTIFLKLRFQKVYAKKFQIEKREKGDERGRKKGRSNSSSTAKNSKVHSTGQNVLGTQKLMASHQNADEFVQKDYDATTTTSQQFQGSLLMK